MNTLDDDGNGELQGPELAGLAVWRDFNTNGVSDPGEVQSLEELYIVKLSCRFAWLDEDPNAIAWAPTGVTFENGAVRPSFDLLLYQR